MLIIVLGLILYVPMAVAPLLKESKQYDENKNTVDKQENSVYSSYCKHFTKKECTVNE